MSQHVPAASTRRLPYRGRSTRLMETGSMYRRQELLGNANDGPVRAAGVGCAKPKKTVLMTEAQARRSDRRQRTQIV